MQCCHGDVMHVSELLNGCLVVDCHLLYLTHQHTQWCPLSTDQTSCIETHTHISHSASLSLSHLFLLLSPQLLHLWPMLRPQVFCLRSVTLPEPLLHSSQLRLLLQLQLLQFSFKRHLQRRLLPMESLPPRRVEGCVWRRVLMMLLRYRVLNIQSLAVYSWL